MLDIGIVIPQLAKYGGAERLVVECLSRWQHRHKLTVYAQSFSKAMLAEHGIENSVKLRTLSPQVEGNTFTFLLNSTFTPKMWSGEIKQHDVYNTHLWPMHLLDVEPAVWYPHEPLRMLYDLRSNKEIISLTTAEERRVHIYPKYNYDTIAPAIYSPMLRATETMDNTGRPFRIVANSAYCAAYIRAVYGREADRIVYPGVNPDDFLPPMGNEYILTVGQLWPHKRIHLILQSMCLVDSLNLYIVGDGPEKENLENQARELGIHHRVFFLSGLTNHELQIVFSRALAVVFMPVREPFGIVALEAMAASKPLVAVNEGGYNEVVDDKCAFLVPPYASALAEKLEWLAEHPAEAAEMGAHGRNLAHNYSWDRTASELLEEIEDARVDWREQNSISMHSQARDVLFGAQYYGWYGNGLGKEHWNDSREEGMVTQMPGLGYYSSLDGDIIERHLLMARDIGLDFLIFNIHVDSRGVNHREVESLSLMLDKAKYLRSPIKLAIQFCFYDSEEKDLSKTFQAICGSAFAHPNYMRFNGAPLLSIFWTGQYDGDATFINLIKKHAGNAYLLASSLRMYPPAEEKKLTFGLFDGWSLFSPLELASRKNWRRVWTEAYGHAVSGRRATRVFTVSPGYDDTALASPARKNNPYRNIPRKKGATYRDMWDCAFSFEEGPEIVIISTFNEMHENTHIEPTVEEGSFYMDMTREFIGRGRELWKK